LELLRHTPRAFDLMITDMTMPNMTGDKLAIKILEINPDLPIILCTGYIKKVPPDRFAGIGISALLMKPLIKKELAATVRKVLDDQK
jgi:two-component system cell cycle sensor histidine kinase/response regulator CckA